MRILFEHLRRLRASPTSRRTFVLSVLLLSLIAGIACVIWCPGPQNAGGLIIVDSPEVYSRERLVNDRFNHDTWLKDKLEKTDNLQFGNQGVLELLVHEKATGSAEVDIESEGPDESENPAQKSKGDQQNSNGEPTGKNHQPAGNRSVIASPIDEFRDRLAYREEVRGEIMETLLDDRHDIKGNTLYRLKFDTTIIPHRDTDSWAFVNVTLKNEKEVKDENEVYERWAKETERRLNESLSNYVRTFLSKSMSPDELLEFFEYMVEELGEDKPESSVEIRDQIRSLDESARKYNEFAQKYNEFAQNTNRRKYIGYFATHGTREELSRYEFEKTRPIVLEYIKHRYGPRYVNVKPIPDLFKRYELWKEEADKDTIDGFKKGWKKEQLRRKQASNRKGRISTALEDSANEAERAVSQAFEREGELLEAALRDWMIHQFQRKLENYAVIKPIGCEHGNCRILLDDKTKSNEKNPVGSLFSDLNKDAPVFSYAVTPKESVQRISEITSHFHTAQLLLGLSVRSGNLGTKEVADFIAESQRLAYQIRRQPIVVGFGSASETNSAQDKIETKFGWLIGPRVDLGAPEDDVEFMEFKHVPIQNALAAVISVPSWWTKIGVEVITCWRSPRDPLWADANERPDPNDTANERPNNDRAEVCDGPAKQKHDFQVKLPFTVTEISRKLGYVVGRVPYIDSDVPNQLGSFYVGQKDASLLIPGGELWRSTVVTMGAQKADRIEVLPNMKGIIATFDPIREQIRLNPEQEKNEQKNTCYAELDVTVWTSEGKTAPRYARVYRAKPDWETGQCAPPSGSSGKEAGPQEASDKEK